MELLQSSPNRETSSATKLRKSTMSRKQTPDGRVFVCCDKHVHNGCGHGGRIKHGFVRRYWDGTEKLRKRPK